MQIGVLEAKNRLSELLERVVNGEDVVITRRGEAVARLTSVQREVTADEVERLIAQGQRLRAAAKVQSSWAQNKADRDEGHRF